MLQYVILGSALWAILQKKDEMTIAIPVALFLTMIALNSYWLILFFIKRRADLALINLCAAWVLANIIFMQMAEIEAWVNVMHGGPMNSGFCLHTMRDGQLIAIGKPQVITRERNGRTDHP